MTKNPRVVLITQARTGSSRLPGKILKKFKGKTLLFWFLCRAFNCKTIEEVCVATTTGSQDDELAELVKADFPETTVVRGPEEDVLARYILAVEETNADVVVRVTSDCPFFDWQLVDRCVYTLLRKKADAVRTRRDEFPIGLDVEVFHAKTLRIAHENSKEAFEREHVGPYIFLSHSSRFNIEWIKNNEGAWPTCRLTLDYPDDLLLIERLYSEVGPGAEAEKYRQFLIKHPDVARINLNCAH